MKIIVDLRSLSGFPWSGVPVYTREICAALTETFPQHSWIGYVGGRSGGLFLPPNDFSGLRWNRTSNILQTMLWGAGVGGRLVDEPVDCYFLPNWNSVPFRLNAPLVITVHDCWIRRMNEDASLKGRLWHWAIRIPRLLRQSQRILAVSNSTAEEVAHFFPLVASRIRVIRSSVQVPPLHACTTDCENFLRYSPYFVVLADSHARKNSNLVISAAKALGVRCHWILVGATPFRSMSPSIHWIGPIEPTRYDALLCHATALVYPTLYEGFGFPPQEAIARGIRTIVSSTPSVAEISGDAALSIFHPNDQEGFLRVIQEALRSPSIEQPLSATLARTWKDVARETMAVLEEAVGMAIGN